jgi:TolB-like protein/DNA-binding winged helix-turn-helix (wHTH) protein/Flp pilus assembly protein TadD
MNTPAHGFVLDALQVEPLAGLVSGPGGRERLDPKVMDVLVHMAEHAGQVVLREELLARLWPHVVVTDDALTRCFYELRRCLVHAGGDERYRALVETIPKRGYRLNGTVKPLKAPVDAPDAAVAAVVPAGRRRGWLAAGMAGFAVAAIAAGVFLWRAAEDPDATAAAPALKSIAVLPFVDMSAGEAHGYLSDGMSEEILNRLSQSAHLRVISRTSSFALRDADLDVPQIADRLGVDYVLEGSVRRADDRFRITVQLIDAATNSHVWSRTYDRAFEDLFAAQDEIAVSVAAAVGAAVDGERPPRRVPASVEAYDRFLQGEFHYHRRLPDDIERAADYYRQAIALDPAYARAWAALAGAYSLLSGEKDEPETHALRQLQGEAAHKAVELNPELAIAQARLGQYYYHVQQHEKGDEHMRRAAELDPNDPLVLAFAASQAIWEDDFAEAARLWHEIVAKDPLSPMSRNNYAAHLHANGQLPEALAEYRRALELNPDAGLYVLAGTARVLIGLGRYDEAAPIIDRLPAGNTRDCVIALLHRAPSRRQEADAALRRLAAATRNLDDEVCLAEAYADRGLKDEAFDLLARRYQALESDRAARPRARWYFQNEIRRSPYFVGLRDDPRWAALAIIPG